MRRLNSPGPRHPVTQLQPQPGVRGRAGVSVKRYRVIVVIDVEARDRKHAFEEVGYLMDREDCNIAWDFSTDAPYEITDDGERVKR